MTDMNDLDKEVDLDFTLDQIDDLPEFQQFPTGSYLVCLEKGIEEKEMETDGTMVKYFSIEGTLKSIEELDEKDLDIENEQPPKVGSVQSFLYKRNHRLAMGAFKQMVAPIAQHFGVNTIREVIEVSKGIDMLWVGERKGKKKDGEMRYNFRVKRGAVV